jgi:hypothetical protein
MAAVLQYSGHQLHNTQPYARLTRKQPSHHSVLPFNPSPFTVAPSWAEVVGAHVSVEASSIPQPTATIADFIKLYEGCIAIGLLQARVSISHCAGVLEHHSFLQLLGTNYCSATPARRGHH